MAEFYDKKRYRIDDIADLFVGRPIPDLGEALAAIEKHPDHARLAPKYGADFARQAREEIAARHWHRSLLKQLGFENERYLYLGKRASELNLDGCRSAAHLIDLGEPPMALCGPLIVVEVKGKAVEVREQHPADSFSDAAPVFSLYGAPAVPCLLAPCTWLGIHPGSSVAILLPPLPD